MKLLGAILAVLALAGCARGAHDEDLPSACRSDAVAFSEALAAAPRPVRVDGVPISACLAKDASQGDVQLVGETLLATAQRLGEERRAMPLGYLVGALRRGAERTQGIHLELVRRIEQEALALRDSRGFERGVRAGRSSG